ncbi:MAG: DUF481 domain-containing protein [Balneolaceae bacterium]|nr:DUF481 domain-containing protein [Balneolaceae bacterium]
MAKKIIYLFALLLISSTYYIQAQESPTLVSSKDSETINVFLDCRGCDDNFIITETRFVNFVRDQGLADVHILVIRQRTSNGSQFLIDYIDQRLPEKPKKEILLDTYSFQTDEEIRNDLVSVIKLGLISYLTDSKILSQLSVAFDPQVSTEANKSLEGDDPWNNWVFEFGVDGNVNGQENELRYNLGGDGEIQRITEEWKIRLNFWGNYNRRALTEEEEVIENNDTSLVETTRYFDRSNQNYFGLVAKTIDDHWSVGFYTRYRSDTFQNIDSQIGITPAIEYSLFPYREFTRREVTARLGLMTSYYSYTETTVLLKDEEFLIRPEIDLRADFTQPWGSFRAGLEAGAFLHDLSLNRFEFDTRVNLRISKYLSVFLNGRYNIISDQISLPAGDLSTEEILAGVRQQATSYSFSGSFGVSVQFGSIYNNIVNPRL